MAGMAVFMIEMYAGYCGAQEVEKSVKEKILVFPFSESGAPDTGIGRSVAEFMVSKLHELGRFEIADRVNIEKIMAEQRLALSGIMDEDTAVKVGNLMGAKLSVMGNVTSFSVGKNSSGGFDGTANVDLKIINVETSMIEKATTVGASASLAAASDKSDETQRANVRSKLIGELGNKAYFAMREMFKLKTYIMTVDGRKVTIRQGEDMGIKPDWRFDAVKKGSVVKDPFTGEILKSNDEEIANIWITKVDKNMSYGKIFTKKGQVTPGMQLVEYPSRNILFKLSAGPYPLYQTGISSSAVYNDGYNDYPVDFAVNENLIATAIGFECGRKTYWGAASFDFDIIIKVPVFGYKILAGGLLDVMRLGPLAVSAGVNGGIISAGAWVGEVENTNLKAPGGEIVPVGANLNINSLNLGGEGLINIDYIIKKTMTFNVTIGMAKYLEDPWSMTATWTPDDGGETQSETLDIANLSEPVPNLKINGLIIRAGINFIF